MRNVKKNKKTRLMQEAKRQACSPVIVLSGLGEYTLWE